MFDISKLEWTREPESFVMNGNTVEIITKWLAHDGQKPDEE